MRNALLPLTIALAMMLGILIGVKFKDYETGDHKRRLLFFSPPTGKTDQVLEIIKKSYVDSVSINMLEEEAIRSMLKNLDPHSQYIPASDFSTANDPIEGNFSGIGVHFNMFDDTIVVIKTIAKGPSEKAGIVAGDRIIRVDDLTVAGVKMSSNDIVNKLKGATGTKVNVGVYRKYSNEELDFTVTRDRVPIFSIDAAYMIAPQTGYIKVNRFSKTTFQEFSEAAEKLKNDGMTKIIIDLRNNPGGIIEGAIKMSEIFLPAEKLIVYTEGNERGRVNHYSKGKNKTYGDMELVLLIDEASASASEIVAGAIQDNDRGKIIGRRSFGKGLVQEQHLLSDGSAVRITVSRYYTPSGRSIQKPYKENDNYNELFGILPDIVVPIDTAAFSKYYRTVSRRSIPYRFAFDYADNNRKELSKITDYKEMETYLRQKNILEIFVDYAAKQGVMKNDDDLKISGPHIENFLIAHIVRNILDDESFFQIFNKMDKIVQKGVEEMKNEK